MDFPKLKALKEMDLTDDVLRSLWYDWFCSDDALVNRAKPLVKIALGITNPKLQETKVLLKNNCPCVGPLYDDIRFSTEDGNLLVVSRKDRREKSLYTCYSLVNDFSAPIIIASRLPELLSAINEYQF